MSCQWIKRLHDTGSPVTVGCQYSGGRVGAGVNRYAVIASLTCGVALAEPSTTLVSY
ncbi:MAG: hypothetical protein QF539_02205 [Luminiphilus sp.]|nr:hypothetical protein [Luminiphilus sp.]